MNLNTGTCISFKAPWKSLRVSVFAEPLVWQYMYAVVLIRCSFAGSYQFYEKLVHGTCAHYKDMKYSEIPNNTVDIW